MDNHFIHNRICVVVKQRTNDGIDVRAGDLRRNITVYTTNAVDEASRRSQHITRKLIFGLTKTYTKTSRAFIENVIFVLQCAVCYFCDLVYELVN